MLIFLYEPFYNHICPAHKAHVVSQKAHLSLCLEWIDDKYSHHRHHVEYLFMLGRPNLHTAVHVGHPFVLGRPNLHTTEHLVHPSL